ncbi:hypothetical protein OF83DRAFT_226861 [Amylostereum chailletii]|nr:hypothetical protein OF83DRAFT_226861 [Amylostereum chailletii]
MTKTRGSMEMTSSSTRSSVDGGSFPSTPWLVSLTSAHRDWPRSNNRLMKAPAVRVDGEMITNDDPWEARWAFKVGTPYPPTDDPFPEYTWVASPTSGIEDSRYAFENDVGFDDEGPVTDIRIDSHTPEGNGAFKYASVYDSKPVVVRSHLDVSLLGHIHIVASEASIQVAEDLLLGCISPDAPSTPASERSSFTSFSSASSVTSEDQYVDAKDMPLDIVEVFSSVHGRLLNNGINALVPRTRTNSYSHIPAPTAPSTPTPSAGSQSGQVSVAVAWSKLTLLKKAMRSWKTKFAYKHASLAGTVPYHSIVLGYRILVSLRGCIPMVALPLCFALGYYALVVR